MIPGIKIKVKYPPGQIVYLKTDTDQKKRMVTQVLLSLIGVTYCVKCGAEESWHFEEEMREEKDTLAKLGI